MRFLQLSIAAFCANVVYGHGIPPPLPHGPVDEPASKLNHELKQFSYYGNSPDIVPLPKCAGQYWLENIQHQGVAAFNEDPAGYQVFRNVKDYGAKGERVFCLLPRTSSSQFVQVTV